MRVCRFKSDPTSPNKRVDNMNKITIKTLNVNLIAQYGKMKLNVMIDQLRNTEKNNVLNIRIEDMADNFHVNPYLEYLGNDKFKFHAGCCFGGQGADWPEFNDNLRALENDCDFVTWFNDNIFPVAEKLTNI